MISMDKAKLGYAAGVVDCDGSISITRSRYKPTGNYTYKLIVQVSTKDISVPNWLYENFKGNIGRYAQGANAMSSGYISKWHINGVNAKAFLESILPYLTEKRSQAKAAIMFPVSSIGTVMPEELKSIQMALYLLLKKQ